MSNELTTKNNLALPDFGSQGWDILVNNNFRKLSNLTAACVIELEGGTTRLTGANAEYSAVKFDGSPSSESVVLYPQPTWRKICFVNNSGYTVFIGYDGDDQKDMVQLDNNQSNTVMFTGSTYCAVDGSAGSAASGFATQSQLGCALFYSIQGQTYLRNVVTGNGLCLTKENENVKISFDPSKMSTQGCKALMQTLGITTNGLLNSKVKVRNSDPKPGHLIDKIMAGNGITVGPGQTPGGSHKLAIGFSAKMLACVTDCPEYLMTVDSSGVPKKITKEAFFAGEKTKLGPGCYHLGGGLLQQKADLTELAEGTYTITWAVAFSEPPDVWLAGLENLPGLTINIDNVTAEGAQISVIDLNDSGITINDCLWALGC